MARSLVAQSMLIGSLALTCVALPFSAVANSEVVSRVFASGTFEGRSDHIVSGGVTVLKTETGTMVVLESDFSLDGAPDPKLGFGQNGYEPSTQFSPLTSNTGAQIYTVPDSVDPTQYNEIWVWCEKFDVPLGVATLK
ncbi:MAG: DM13 domain-containing protein [Cyanothece sp. SIO1E1]|nr:DM13 domain-containing protein [Cyanothece sp. SIO1E1]